MLFLGCALLFWFVLGKCEIITLDMSYEYIENDTYFFYPHHLLKLEPDSANGRNPVSGWYTGYKISMGEHGGTHMDAPHHMYEQGITLGKIPLSRLLNLPLVVVDLTDKVKQDNDTVFTIEDFKKWEERYGVIPEGSVVYVRSGWDKNYPIRELYLGSSTNNWMTDFHFPGYDPDTATWLGEKRKIYGVGTEAASLDSGQNLKLHKAHVNFFKLGVWGAECVANMDKVPPTGARINHLPVKLAKGSGGATRIFATWNTEPNIAPKLNTQTIVMFVTIIVMYL